MQEITGLPGTHDRYSSFIFVEFERRVATGPGVYTSTFYRYVNARRNVTYNGAAGGDRPTVGAVFTARTFDPPTVVADSQLGNTTQLSFDDHDGVLKSTAIINQMNGWKARIWEMGVDADFNITWCKLKASGETQSVNWDVNEGDVLAVDIRHGNSAVTLTGPLEEWSIDCRFKTGFKTDPRCGYSGPEATCDGLLTTCTRYGNQVRYGGFPDTPGPGDRVTIWSGIDVDYDSRPTYFPPTETD